MKDIERFNKLPKEVVDRMLEEQVRQGNKKDIGVFENFITAGKNSGGFNWHNTIEGHYFWRRTTLGNFDLFFEKYPKQEYPKVMYVWDDKIEKPLKRVVVARIDGGYVAFYNETTLEKITDNTDLRIWKYAKDIETSETVSNIEIEIEKLMTNFQLNYDSLISIAKDMSSRKK